MDRHFMTIQDSIDKSLKDNCPIRKSYWPENLYVIAVRINGVIVLFQHFKKANGEIKVTRYEPSLWEGVFEPEWV